MKKILCTLVICFGFLAAHADTLDTVKSVVHTNLNEVVISILSGVKDAGGEIYGASKQALAQSLEFVKEQAPDVVSQFIKWHLAENVVLYLVWLIPSIGLLIGAWRVLKYGKDNGAKNWCDDDKLASYVARYLLIVLAIGLFMVNTCNYGANAVKIMVAPKVFILEYLVNTVKH